MREGQNNLPIFRFLALRTGTNSELLTSWRCKFIGSRQGPP